MALETVVIKIVSDTKDIKKTTQILEEQGKVEKKNVAIFEAANKKRAFLLEANIKRLNKLRVQRKAAFNPIDIRRFDERIKETTKDIEILGGRFEKADKKAGILSTTLGKLGAIALGAFAVRGIINFTEHLFEVSAESEAFEKRARVVFGSSLEIVEEFAKESANSLGLTEVAFLGAAAAIGDILVPLGLSRERAAEMSVEAVKLGGALKEFTGDSRSAAEISNIVARSLTGEVEGLKTLGVVIDQTSVQFKELVKSKQVDLGLTQQQAKAEAIFQIAIQSSGDALRSFETNTDSLIRQESILTARFEEQTEHLAEFLTPAFLAVLKGVNSLTDTTKDLVKETVLQNKAFLTQSKEVNVLVDRYEELTSQTDLNSDEQAELRDIIVDLSDRVPEATTEFDKYGTALDINTDKVRANLKQQQELLVLRNAEVIREIRGEIRNFTKDVEKNTETLQRGFVTTTTFSKTGGKVFIENTELSGRAVKALANENKVLNADIADLLLNLDELGIELTDVEKAFIDAALGTEKFRKEGEDDSIIKEQIRNIFLLKNAISVLRKEQAEQGTSIQRVSEINRELIPLQKELNDLLGKTKGSDPVKLLSKRISELRAELLNQALSGKVSKDTIKELNEAVRTLARAEVDLKIALTDTLDPLESQALKIQKIGKEAQSASSLISDFEQIQRDEIEATANKRLNAIAMVSEAEQSAFRILDQINENKLIAIDNEEFKALKALENKGLAEEELAERQKEILEDASEARKEILRKQAQTDKIARIFDATINTAVAVTRALASTANPIFAAIIGALGAAEIAVIAAQPIPEFHEGKKSELKPGEINATILKAETIIPPDQSKKHKGLLDAVLDKNVDSYVFQEYMIPMMKGLNKGTPHTPYNDIHIWNMQKRQLKATHQGNVLIERLAKSLGSGSHRRTWR